MMESLRQSSAIFGKIGKFSENARQRSCDLRTTFVQSSESGRKSSENRQIRHHHYVYIISIGNRMNLLVHFVIYGHE